MTIRNPNAGPVTRALIAALEATAPNADAQRPDAQATGAPTNDLPKSRRVADKLIEKALGGDLSAIKKIFDRVDGKAPSAAAGLDSDEPRKVIYEWKRSQ